MVMGGACGWGGAGGVWELHFLLDFAANLKLLSKIVY